MITKVMCENCKTIIECNIKNRVGLDSVSASVSVNTDAGAVLLDGGDEYVEVECPECGRIITLAI